MLPVARMNNRGMLKHRGSAGAVLLVFWLLWAGCVSVWAEGEAPAEGNPHPAQEDVSEGIRLKGVVLFGDSLSDTENTRQLIHYLSGDPGKPWFYDDLFSRLWKRVPVGMFINRLPPLGYAGGRFSNGLLAGEMAVPMLGIDSGDMTNLAFAGSWTVSSGRFISSLVRNGSSLESFSHISRGNGKWLLPSMEEMVDWYIREQKRKGQGQLDEDTLYVIASGSNDYQNRFWDVDMIVDTQIEAIDNLVAAGARHIGWGTLPDLTLTPCFADDDEKDVIRNLVDKHNQKIVKAKDMLGKAYPHVKITFVHSHDGMKLCHKHAEEFGFRYTDRACTNVTIDGCSCDGVSIMDGKGIEICDNPDEYFFWDAVHPTTRAYQFTATYLCVTAGLAGYWTNCRLPSGIDGEKAGRLAELIAESLPEELQSERHRVYELLHLKPEI